MKKNLTFEERDEFNRKPFAEQIITFLASDSEISPIVIDGAWGTGKSEFCLKLINLINDQTDQKFRAIYFDAFSEDYFSQPLISLLSVLYRNWPNERFKEELSKHAGRILKATLKTGANILIDKFYGDSAKIVGTFSQELSGDETFSTLFQERSTLEDTMQKVVQLIDEKTQEQELILFIDELDRCRPDYTIQLFETIKHFQSLPKFKIIFVANMEQVISSVGHMYGISKESATTYLNKFFKIITRLPPHVFSSETTEKSQFTSVEYFHVLSEKCSSQIMLDIINQIPFKSLIDELIQSFNFSLRDVERFFMYLKIQLPLVKSFNSLDAGYQLITVFIIFSISRNAPWIYSISKNNESLGSISPDLQIRNVKHSGISLMHQVHQCLFSDSPELPNYFFNGWIEPLSSRQNFFIKTLSNLRNFVMLR
ncbi:MAG TPA: hypothetical protein IAC66_02365 [Candidatus Aphodousia gallistercoris]|nr:hypothetical protein [Candidatus Aphodousia gallistercoris]